MNARITRPGYLCLLAALFVSAVSVGALAEPLERPVLRLTAERETGVELELRVPPSAVEILVDADERRSLRIGDLGNGTVPGSPELPVALALVGVPEGAEIRLTYETSPEIVHVGRSLRAVPTYDPETRTSTRLLDPTVYTRSAAWPEQSVVIEELRFRGVRLARVLVYPARYRPADRELLLTDSIRVRLDFVGGDGFRRLGGPLDRVLDGIVARHVLNADSVRAGRRPVKRRAAEKSLAAINNPGVKIRVDEPGLVRVTQAQLSALGFDPQPVDPRNLEVSYRGTPIPCRVIGENDGSFDSGDAIEFYGVPGTSRFSAENTYWLEEQNSSGLRFATVNASPGGAVVAAAFPHTEHYEESNDEYTLGAPAQDGDPHFYWAEIQGTAPSLTHSAVLPGITAGTDATFRALFFGRTDVVANPDHHVRFKVNNTIIGETTWNGRSFHLAEITFNRSLLNAGSNAFRVEYVSIASPDIYYLDWMEIVYPRATVAVGERLTLTAEDGTWRYQVAGMGAPSDPVVLDVSDPLSPVQLTSATIAGGTLTFQVTAATGARYHVVGNSGRIAAASLELDVPSNLSDPANGADLIVITPPGWESAMSALVARRQAQGLRVVLTNLTDVADEFAGGNQDDVAIRDFVAYAYANWQGPPVSYVLLVGEPSLDPQNWLGESPVYSFMPTHFGVTTSQGETISDTWFGAVDGPDLLPDVAIGRFSVRSAAAAQALAAKILDYEDTAPIGSGWTTNLVHVASNEAPFETVLESAADLLPPGFTVDTHYRRFGGTAFSIRLAIDAGALMTSFVGHGNALVWADVASPSGTFFSGSNVGALTNDDRLTFVTALDCLNGSIGDPLNPDSLSEVFHNAPDAGAFAMWSPSALGLLGQYDRMQRVLYRTIFQDNVQQVGASTTGALVETFLTQQVSIDLIKEMILLADPSSRLALECTATGVDSTCDGLDDDCDGTADDEFLSESTTCGLGACASTGTTQCVDAGVIDSCQSGVPTSEMCGNAIDEDCDGETDEGDAIDATTWYPDADGDSFGDPGQPLAACLEPAGYVTDSTDCDDGNGEVWAPPGEEATNLHINDVATATWDPPVVTGAPVVGFLLRSPDPAEFTLSTTCIEPIGGSETEAVVAATPPPGGAYFYLARWENACPDGGGPLGFRSDGAPRTGRSCSPP